MLINVLLTSEVAQMLGVSEGTVRVWERSGRLRATKTARGVRLFDRRDVERLARERNRSTSAKATAERPLKGSGHAR
jgi:excisionase family DNA binding protein